MLRQAENRCKIEGILAEIDIKPGHFNKNGQMMESIGGSITVKVVQKISGEEKELAVEGLFIAIGQMPDNQAFADQAELDEKGYIIAGEDCLTKTPGIYTAGDCRTKAVRQLTTAAADGAVAALAACAKI
jgi:thioredoxin reductase (NADPH)